MAVLVLLHLVARADPAAELRLRRRIRIEVARTQRPTHLLDVAREALDDRLRHAAIGMEEAAGLLGVLRRVRPHLVDVGLGGLGHQGLPSASSIFFGLKPASLCSPIRITGSDVRPISISSSRAPGSRPTLRSVNAMPFCDRYSVAR